MKVDARCLEDIIYELLESASDCKFLAKESESFREVREKYEKKSLHYSLCAQKLQELGGNYVS